MNRRDFLTAASGVAGGAAAASAAAAAQEETTTSGSPDGTTGGNATGNGTTSAPGGGGGGGTATVAVGPGGDYVFTPGTEEPLYISPGTTVTFNWESDNHNINPTSVPEGATWEGHLPTENTGFTYEHTFETLGTYEYQCDPHVGLGMVGTIVVNETGQTPGGGEGGGEVDPEEMGVPIQAHWVGIATILAIMSSLMFTFYVLKYGESAHSSSPGRK
ncbi:plastocyanin/azurin family copper-binding protein [Haloarchaeobius sp. HRN-SO-5]|uniref:plastocyanin/azurin family copper-binding protein n=1 Tax=Haloarchaeobius sp. HRN-SO-5 TaxID=3446118 RepID=UPI003EBAEC23